MRAVQVAVIALSLAVGLLGMSVWRNMQAIEALEQNAVDWQEECPQQDAIEIVEPTEWEWEV
jgi:hypothetical protein